MRRILVVGCAGAGKSTLARELGAALELPVIHLDRHYWRPGWVETPDGEWDEAVRELVAGDVWVMDGNYGRTMALRLEAADTALFLDFPRFRCLANVFRRRIAHAGRTRPDMTPGCPERVGWDFVSWIWGYPRRSRPNVLKNLEAFAARGGGVVRLTSHDAVREFLQDVQRARAGEGQT